MNDLRYAWRQLLRNAGFALAAMLTLGLGIGLVATQYSLIDGVLLRPLPFVHAERIVHVARAAGEDGDGWAGLRPDDYRALAEQQGSFERFAGWRSETYNLAAEGELPQRLWGAAVTPEFFDVLGVAPAIGRALEPADARPGQPQRALIGHHLYVSAFGADPSVVGRSVHLNGEQTTIIGVLPPGFRFPGQESVWVNLRLPPAGAAPDPLLGMEAMGRLAPGHTAASAAAELSSLLQRHRSDLGEARDGGTPARVQPFQRAYNGGGTIPLLWTLFGMTGFVLLLACTNVASLMFVRGSDRLREVAVRSALGAGRRRIARQVLAEGLLLGWGGGLLGLLFAQIGIGLLQSQANARLDMPAWMYFDLNLRVLGVALLVALAAGMLAGLLPALRAARLDLARGLREGARSQLGGGRVGAWMAAGQLAFACAALVVAALLGQSLLANSRLNLAWDPDALLIGRLELQGPAYADESARTAFYERLLASVRAVPGVAAAAVSSRDLVDQGVGVNVELEGVAYPRDQDRPEARLEVVSHDYFALLRQRPLEGRLFDASDRADSVPVAVVNQSLAARLWPGRSALGQRLRRGLPGEEWVTVVGVVADLHLEGLGNNDDGAGYYLLQAQQGWGWLELLVRTEGAPASVIDAVRAAVAAIDPLQPIHSIATLSERSDRRLAGMQIIGGMAGVFALCALLLAAVGVYGVMAYATRLREREFGLRMALGAAGGSLEWMALRQGAPQALAGIGGGLLLGYLLAQPLAPGLSLVAVDDVRIYLAVAMLLAGAAFVASWWPARRAAAIDPIEALRGD